MARSLDLRKKRVFQDLQDQRGVGEGSGSGIWESSGIRIGRVGCGEGGSSVGGCNRSGVGGQSWRGSHDWSTVGTVGSYRKQRLGGNASDGQEGEEDLLKEFRLNSSSHFGQTEKLTTLVNMLIV